MAKVSRTSEKLAPLKTRSRKSASGTVGASVRSSQMPKAARARTATASETRVPRSSRPVWADSMIVQTSAVMPIIDRTMPSGSALRAGPFDSGIRTSAATMARAAIGTFIRKTEPHQKWAISTPPSTGPPTRPTAATALHALIALRRSPSSKTVIRIDSVLGMTRAPPTPISTRPAMSCSGFCATVASSDAAPKTARPTIITRRRPSRSERLPAVSSSPAKTRMYESMIHWMS